MRKQGLYLEPLFDLGHFSQESVAFVTRHDGGMGYNGEE
jgi:hypothetical protein